MTDPLIDACAKAIAWLAIKHIDPVKTAEAVLRIARPAILEEAAKMIEDNQLDGTAAEDLNQIYQDCADNVRALKEKPHGQ